MAVLKADLNTLSGRIKATEDIIQSLGIQQNTTANQLHEVSNAYTALSVKVGQLEDITRQCNLKIRMIPEIIEAGELPQFIRRLMSATLPHKQAKNILLEGIYRLPVNPNNKASFPNDVILSFRSRSDK
ncbi:Hypothetical predicted protein [Pelobates cultripes]|uniref:Uncharacterized protein n=1 Tax=Pelobates cultripes TaxID=61616 RepID=A0AAD1S7U1_PELCU|nr:Hypothetical predicted protein [Pelobates cultripes]